MTREAVIEIGDADDPRIAAYRDIRERDLVGRQGLFVAEGKVVLNMLVASTRFAPVSLLLLKGRMAGMEEVLSRLAPDVPVYVAERAVMDAVAGFPIHRGVLAIARPLIREDAEALLSRLPERALAVVPVGISNHDNMGSIFRNAAAFGADAVLADETCCDPLYRKAIRVSVGATLKVPFARQGSAADLIDTLQRSGFELLALGPRAPREIRDVARPKRLALLLGTEGEGLPQSLLDTLPSARIAIEPDFDSLNVAAASAIALHHFRDA